MDNYLPFFGDTIPLYECKAEAMYCNFQRLLHLSIFCSLFLIGYQMVFVYYRSHFITLSDSRQRIFLICQVSTLFNLFHYGVYNHNLRPYSFFMIEVFRTLIMFSICYYYCTKAIGLLPHHKKFLLSLQIWGFVSIVMLISLGFITISRIDKNSKENQGKQTCQFWSFKVNRAFPISINIIFFLIYWQLKKKIYENAESSQTQASKNDLEAQLQTLAKLKTTNMIFTFVSVTIFLWEKVILFTVNNTKNPNDFDCSKELFNLEFLDNLMWFITRFLQSQSAVFACYILFKKKRVDRKKRKQILSDAILKKYTADAYQHSNIHNDINNTTLDGHQDSIYSAVEPGQRGLIKEDEEMFVSSPKQYNQFKMEK